MFEKIYSDWLAELSSVIKNHDKFIHHSITMTLAESSKKENEREKISGLKGKRQLYKPKNIHGDLVRSADT